LAQPRGLRGLARDAKLARNGDVDGAAMKVAMFTS